MGHPGKNKYVHSLNSLKMDKACVYEKRKLQMLNQLLLCVQTIGGEESVKTVILGEANLFLPETY